MATYEIIGIVKSTGRNRRFKLDADFEEHAYDLAAERGVVVETCTKIGEPSALQKNKGVPEYGVLQAIGSLYTVVGVIVVIFAIVLLFIAINSFTGPPDVDFRGREINRSLSILEVIPAFTTGITGLFILGAGQAIYAFRDIARNSWR